MIKNAKRPGSARIAELARRREGASYSDAGIATVGRLLRLKEEFAAVPPAYRGYLAVGICSCLESHLKYSYAAAIEGYDDHPDVLKALLSDVQIDIETLISTNSRLFSLADVVAASIAVSSFVSYREKASHFFQVFTGERHDFPWDYVKTFVTSGNPSLEKEYAAKLERLELVFDARHKFVHETTLLSPLEFDIPESELLDCADDAISLMEQFETQYEQVGMHPKYAAQREGETVEDAVARHSNELEDAFEWLSSICDESQRASLAKFKKASNDYIWARSEFETSVYVSDRLDWTMRQFLDLAPEHLGLLREIGARQKYMLSDYPIAEQIADLASSDGRGPSD